MLKALALETIESYPQKDALRVYTDGSSSDAVRTGYGFSIECPNGSTVGDCGNCGRYRSKYEAEGRAIYLALCKVAKGLGAPAESGKGDRPRQVVVFSDAKSVLDALQNWSVAAPDPILGEVVRVVDMPRSGSFSVTFQWVPGHCGIPGNVRADVLAYKGSLRDPEPLVIPQNNTTWETVKHVCRRLMQDQWMSQCASSPKARAVARYMPRPVEDDAWMKLDRRDQTAIFGLARAMPISAPIST